MPRKEPKAPRAPLMFARSELDPAALAAALNTVVVIGKGLPLLKAVIRFCVVDNAWTKLLTS